MASPLRATLLTAGLAMIGFGTYGLLNDAYVTAPADVLVWAFGALLLHDGLWVPLLCLAGAYLARGPVLRGWLTVTAAVTAVGLPAVLRAGDDHGNPSLLPLPYLRNWLLVLAATALVALAVGLVRRWRHGTGPVRRPAAREERPAPPEDRS
ncbi:hypothetical protein AB0442_08665 [Kitasatospora sp. NPDC085895]|uniref:hypothetical protein n=1 Tax=Kitasatospora sp. NPDC085895 TaxID=3155057 RepID=UPI00344CDF5A